MTGNFTFIFRNIKTRRYIRHQHILVHEQVSYIEVLASEHKNIGRITCIMYSNHNLCVMYSGYRQ